MASNESSPLQQQGGISFRATPMEACVESSWVGPYSAVIAELTKYCHGQVSKDTSEYDTCPYIKNMLDQVDVHPTDTTSDADGYGWRDKRCWYVQSMKATRKNAGMGELHVSVIGARRINMVSIDFETFSRPILGYVFPDETADEAVERVNRLTRWSNMKDTDHLSEYVRYQYNPSSVSQAKSNSAYYLVSASGKRGYARKIAVKMRKGIDSFDRYIPVVTISRISGRLPISQSGSDADMWRLTQVGTQGAFPNLQDPKGVINSTWLKNIIAEIEYTVQVIANANPLGGGSPGQAGLTWQIFGDSLTVDQNFIFTRTIQLRGITEADTDLYPDRSSIQWG